MARPLEHDREEVIAAAMELFWHKGYAATSLADLKAATGLNSGSIYSSYKSKEDLFIATLRLYCDQSVENLDVCLSSTPNYIDNIYLFFERFKNCESQTAKGCFFVNTLVEMAPHHDTIQQLLKEYTERYQQVFNLALTQAKARQQVSESLLIEVTANQLLMAIWGLRVMQRSGVNIDTDSIITLQLDSILRR